MVRLCVFAKAKDTGLNDWSHLWRNTVPCVVVKRKRMQSSAVAADPAMLPLPSRPLALRRASPGLRFRTIHPCSRADFETRRLHPIPLTNLPAVLRGLRSSGRATTTTTIPTRRLNQATSIQAPALDLGLPTPLVPCLPFRLMLRPHPMLRAIVLVRSLVTSRCGLLVSCCFRFHSAT